MEVKARAIFALLLLGLALPRTWAIDLTAALAEMQEYGIDVHSFRDSKEGEVIVATEEIPLSEDTPESVLQEIAVARCEEKINGLRQGRLMSSDQSVEMTSVGDEGQVMRQNDIREEQSGTALPVMLYSSARENGALAVVCYTSDALIRLREPSAESPSSTPRASKTSGSANAVELVVTGIVPAGKDPRQTREAALNSARREAVKQGLGATISSMTSFGEYDIQTEDSEGNTSFSHSERARARIYTSAGGFAEILKVLKEEEKDGYLRITVRARVYRDRLEQDYSPALKQLGDPAFYLEAAPAVRKVFREFLVEKGFRMTNAANDADYTFLVKVKFTPAKGGGGEVPEIALELRQRSTRNLLMEVHSDPAEAVPCYGEDPLSRETALGATAATMTIVFHQHLNDAIGKLNANGRPFVLRLEGVTRFNAPEVKTIREIVDGTDGVQNLNETENIATQVREFHFGYVGDSSDLAQTLKEAFEAHLTRKKHRPRLKSVDTDKIIFAF